jgi:hypothetical protein
MSKQVDFVVVDQQHLGLGRKAVVGESVGVRVIGRWSQDRSIAPTITSAALAWHEQKIHIVTQFVVCPARKPCLDLRTGGRQGQRAHAGR